MLKVFSNDHAVTVAPVSILFTLGVILALYGLFLIKSIIAMLLVAVIVMAALNPAVSLLERRLRIPRLGGIVIMYVLMITVISVAIALIVPPLIPQLEMLLTYWDFEPIQRQILSLEFSVTELRDIVSSIGGSVNNVIKIITSTFNGIFTFFTVTVMAFYLLIDRTHLHKKAIWFTSNKKHIELTREFINSIEYQLGGWVRGQIILMFVIGLTTFIGLTILGVPYALPLAILAGVLEILPNLGPTIAAVPALFFAGREGGVALFLMTLAFYLVVQQLENNLIVPKIMKDNADVNPLTSIVVILTGLKLAGVVGALLAVPVYIILRSLYSLWLREHRT
jgi:predicted PurR-regulated permease PerM